MGSLSAAIFMILMFSLSIGEGRENCPTSMPPTWYEWTWQEWTWQEWTWARFEDSGTGCGHEGIQIRRRTRMPAEACEGRECDGLLDRESKSCNGLWSHGSSSTYDGGRHCMTGYSGPCCEQTSTNTSTSGTPATSTDRMSSGKSSRRSNSKLRQLYCQHTRHPEASRMELGLIYPSRDMLPSNNSVKRSQNGCRAHGVFMHFNVYFVKFLATGEKL